MADASTGERLKVFISYSRRDASDFADELLAGLELAGFSPLLDRQDIAAGEDWEGRLGGLIAQSDTVVFVVSPEAVKSERCVWEVDKTSELSKRLLPVIYLPVPESELPPQLARLQFVRFDNARGVARPLADLAAALRLDLDWIREHSRIGELAARWQGRGRPDSLLLRGDDLEAAKAWEAKRKAEAPAITASQREFLDASEAGETARLARERVQLEEMGKAQAATARSQKRVGLLLWCIGATVLAMLGYALWKDYDVARREVAVFASLASRSLNDDHADRAMRYALQAFPARGSIPGLTPRSTELEGKLAGAAFSTRLHRLLLGHSDAITRVSYSPDGKTVLTSSFDKTARLWDVESGRLLRVLEGHTSPLTTALFSSNGSRIVTAGDHTARIWNTATGKELAILKGHTGDVWNAMFSPDGKYMVTASDDRTARLWDAENGKALITFAGHLGTVADASFNREGDRIVTASADRTARVWDVGTGREVAVLSGHTAAVGTAYFSPDGTRVLTASSDGTVRLWDAVSGHQTAVLQGHTAPVVVARFSPDGTRVFSVSNDTTTRIWEASSGKEVRVLRGHRAGLSDVAVSPDGTRLLTASLDRTARIWDTQTGEVAVFEGHARPVKNVAFSPDGARVITGSDDNTARIWDARIATGALLREISPTQDQGLAVSGRSGKVALASLAEGIFTVRVLNSEGESVALRRQTSLPIESLRLSPNGRHLFTFGKATAVVWDLDKGEMIAELPHDSPVTGLVPSPDGSLLMTTADHSIRIWNAQTGSAVSTVSIAESSNIVFSEDARRIAVAAGRSDIAIFDVATGARTALLQGSARSAPQQFSPDGKWVLTVSDGWTARIWDADSGQEVVVLTGHRDWVTGAAFSPDGKTVATISRDHLVRFWSTTGGDPIVVANHGGELTSLSFSPDGKTLVTASGGSVARLWDVQSGAQIAVLVDGRNGIRSVAFNRLGDQVVTTSAKGVVRIWDVAWATLVRGDELRDRVCAEKLVGKAQEFTDADLDDPVLRGIDRNDPIARNPCLRRGPLSWNYWVRLPGQWWRSMRALGFAGG
jgi:WD40 repeat protein